jgi:alpha-L-arabinofuranosidase
MQTFRSIALIVWVSIISVRSLWAQTTLTIDAGEPQFEIQPTMWGIFFEDINFAADGGLYAELVKNRSFEFDSPLMGWRQNQYDHYSINQKSGAMMVINRGAEESNPRFARVSVNSENPFVVVNEGFFGMGFKKDLKYHFSLEARPVESKVLIRAELLNEKGDVIGSGTIKPDASDWRKYTATITSGETSAKGKLRMVFEGKGVVDIDLVSLMPTDTWKGTALRADLVQLLYDMNPGFLRFPGGCIVEGRDLAQRYQWKKTVGKVDERELMINRWNTEFAHRPAPDYFQSFGLGFFEYFKLAEDIGAAPLPILSCGMACQFNTAEVVPMDELDPYIQDALDLIEFANGDVTTKWGKLRGDMGHPAPFNLKMIGVGNEQWGPQYIERYQVFASAIKSKYPGVKIVSGTGPFPDGELFEYAAAELKKLNADIVDEHYYRAPDWFLKNTTRYDTYDRKGPKIFAGEYAAQSKAIASIENRNNWECALSEAAYMTGLERNADVVHLASYAPLFAHAEGWQWTPDLIWFNNLQAYGTPNYYVQKLFSSNKGTHAISILSGNEKVTGQQGLYASAVIDQKTKEVIVKVVNTTGEKKALALEIKGVKLKSKGVVSLLTSTPESVNTFNDPATIKPSEAVVSLKGSRFKGEVVPYSLSVYRFKVQ